MCFDVFILRRGFYSFFFLFSPLFTPRLRRSQNKVFLNTDSLLLDLVSGQGDAGIKSSMGGTNKQKSSWR